MSWAYSKLRGSRGLSPRELRKRRLDAIVKIGRAALRAGDAKDVKALRVLIDLNLIHVYGEGDNQRRDDFKYVLADKEIIYLLQNPVTSFKKKPGQLTLEQFSDAHTA